MYHETSDPSWVWPIGTRLTCQLWMLTCGNQQRLLCVVLCSKGAMMQVAFESVMWICLNSLWVVVWFGQVVYVVVLVHCVWCFVECGNLVKRV